MRLAGPVVLANVFQTLYQLTDTFWVGRLGADAVAAVSFSFPVIFLFIAVAGGMTIAGTILVAQAEGRGDARQVEMEPADILCYPYPLGGPVQIYIVETQG